MLSWALQVIEGRFLLIYLGDDVIHVGLGDVEVALFADAPSHQLLGAIPVQAGGAQAGVQSLQKIGVGGEARRQAGDLLLEGLSVDAKQHIPFLDRLVGLDRDVGDSSLDQGTTGVET